MPITVVGGKEKRRGGEGGVSRQTFTQSTATADQTINLFVDQASIIGISTATTVVNNRYFLASGADEGREVWIYATASGNANVYLAGGTATGRWLINHADDWILTRYQFGRWWVISTNDNSAFTKASTT